MDKIKFSKEIGKSKMLDSNGLYALDVFDGEGSCNDSIDSNIIYSMWLGLYPKQVQMEWQHSKVESPRVQRW